MKDPVSITAIWLRKKGKDEVELLIERDGVWCVVGKEYYPTENEISHIWEASALHKAKYDSLTKTKAAI